MTICLRELTLFSMRTLAEARRYTQEVLRWSKILLAA
jgi:hypothetical protein